MAKRILTIDDSKTMRDMLLLTLTDAGFEVLQGVDGQDGLDVLGDERVDVVITDINMPKMDGYEVIRQLRQNPRHKTTPILVLTTESDADKKVHCPRCRCHGLDGQAVRSGTSDRHHPQGCTVGFSRQSGIEAMASLEELKHTFFDECSELLQEIETGLTDLQDGTGSDDTVHAVFRAVHSVKGGAGIFGFEALVEFAHVFETVLDSVRHGTLNATPEVINVLLTASDVLSDLVAMSRSGETIPAGSSARMPRRAGAADREWRWPVTEDDNCRGAGDFGGLDFMPVRFDDFEEAAPTTASALHHHVPAEGRRCSGTPTSRSTFCASCASSASSTSSPDRAPAAALRH